mgnify:CR=1 FL=1
MLYVKRELDWLGLREMSWSGAFGVIKEIEAQEREGEAMEIIEDCFDPSIGIPDETELNDFIWFDLPDMMNLYGDEDEEDDDE